MRLQTTILAVFLAGAGLLAFPRPAGSFWFLCKLWAAADYADASAEIAKIPNEDNDPEIQAIKLKIQDELVACGIEAAIEAAKDIPGTSFTGAPPTSVAAAATAIVREATAALVDDKREPHTVSFGDLTRTGYLTSQATHLSLPMFGAGSDSAVASGAWTVGTRLAVPDLELPPGDFVYSATNPRSFGFIEVTSVDVGTDSYEALLVGLAGEDYTDGAIPFLSNVERIDPQHLELLALHVPTAAFVVEAGNDCAGTVVEFPVQSINDPFSSVMGDTTGIFARTITVLDPGVLTPPYEIRIRLLTGILPSNEVIFDGQEGTVFGPPDTCYQLLCADRDDPDQDGHGTACDNCPADYNPQQQDADDNGVGDACETVSAPVLPSPVIASLRSVPNPFNPRLDVRFELSRAATVDVTVFDLRGRRVRGIVSGRALRAGPQTFVWNGNGDDARPVSSGSYIIRVSADGETRTAKVALVH